MLPEKILIIQTAFIGDVILMTPLIEKLAFLYPQASLDILVNQSNQTLFQGHPKIRKVWIWDKKQQKYKKLSQLVRQVRKEQYDLLVNCHRFASSGLLTVLSGAKMTVGFDKNPLSAFYTQKIPHRLEEGLHEVDRNLALISALTGKTEQDEAFRQPVLYPSTEDYQSVAIFQREPYLCMAPTSVWFTKQFPQEKWVQLIKQIPFEGNIYLLGGPADQQVCETIRQQAPEKVSNLAGKLSLLASAALMQKAVLNYVNDSAPLHLASAVNAPVCVVYCSTVPAFGFYPLSDFSAVVEVQEKLACRPCGLHGYKACPEGHFKCARDITIPQLIQVLKKAYDMSK